MSNKIFTDKDYFDRQFKTFEDKIGDLSDRIESLSKQITPEVGPSLIERVGRVEMGLKLTLGIVLASLGASAKSIGIDVFKIISDMF